MFLVWFSLLCLCLAKRNELLPYNPLPNPQSVVQYENVRFTVLTNRLIRMEYSTKGHFEDRPTLAFVNRYLLKPSFTHSVSNGYLMIVTSDLTLQYQLNQPFSSSSLKITSMKGGFSWTFGDRNDGNLLGTIKSLDMLDVISLNCTENANRTVHDEDLHCAWGLISRQGWTVVNDTANWGINNNDWWDSPNTDLHDLYFFGHGSDYVAALSEYSQVGGKIPMVPRNVVGVWWSRWYDLNNRDVQWIVEKYQQLALPLDVFILDMDWHTKEGWGGYSFDERLFPIPQATMSWLHDHGLIVGANIHDDDGVRPTEKMYPEMAKAMGITNGKTIPFAICSNETYMFSLEDIVLADAENQGMDFWWIDWQQGGREGGCEGHSQNPTIWLNKIRATDHIRKNNPVRGLVLSRWGGLGTHRYQVGFSGDVDHLSWDDLAYQPYFSSTASNVGYGFWSHDLIGSDDHELHTRWLQWGIYSAVFRTHDRGMAVGQCNDHNPSNCAIVEVWNVPAPFFDINREAMVTRAHLTPYIYTAYRTAFDVGLSILRPMYYEFPHHNEAYLADQTGKFGQYFFGGDMIIAPITSQMLQNNSMSPATIWVPPGQWFLKDSGKMYDGGSRGIMLSNFFDLTEIPVFVRAGAVIPGVPVAIGNTVGIAARQYTQLVATIYPGKQSGQTRVYEDDGYTTDYLSGKSTWTTISYTMTATTTTVTVPAQKSVPYSGFPSQRSYTIRLVNYLPPTSVHVNGLPVPYQRHGAPNSWHYDGEKLTLVIQTSSLRTNGETSFLISTPSFDQNSLSGLVGMMSHCSLAKTLLDQTNETPGSFSTTAGQLQRCGSTPQLLSYLAGTDLKQFLSTVQGFPALFDAAYEEVRSLKPNSPEQVTPKRWGKAIELMNTARK